LACRFWRRRFKKKISVFLLFFFYLPLERVNPRHLNKLEYSPPRMICAKFGEIGPVVLEKKSKM
jgi:hypothetical protein